MRIDDNPYEAPLSPLPAADRGSLARDVFIIGIAVGTMAVIPLVNPWLVVWGWGPLHVPLLLVIGILIGTAVAGAMTHRPSVGIAGIAMVWAIWMVSDALTSSSSLTSILLDYFTGIGTALFSVQLAAFLVLWWIAKQARTYNERNTTDRIDDAQGGTIERAFRNVAESDRS